uniref:PHB domain-containing protein n=1 Tax=Globodera pallida TaxID=36090 RepID=A0A183CEG9_GLOPA
MSLRCPPQICRAATAPSPQLPQQLLRVPSEQHTMRHKISFDPTIQEDGQSSTSAGGEGFRQTMAVMRRTPEAFAPPILFRPGTPPLPTVPMRRLTRFQLDPNRLAPPSVYALGITDGEAPPQRKDTVEKIPIRARSQSWLIRTRHLLDDEKVSKEYERAVVFRLGRLIKRGTKGPGMFFIMPCIDTFKMVDLRVLSFDVPPQEILSRDTVTVSVEAVIYFRISNPVISVTNVNDAQFSTKLLAQTTLRNVLGTKTLSEILQERDIISSITEKVLDDGTDPWGVKVERVEIKDIRLPQQLMKSHYMLHRKLAELLAADTENVEKVLLLLFTNNANQSKEEPPEFDGRLLVWTGINLAGDNWPAWDDFTKVFLPNANKAWSIQLAFLTYYPVLIQQLQEFKFNKDEKPNPSGGYTKREAESLRGICPFASLPNGPEALCFTD